MYHSRRRIAGAMSIGLALVVAACGGSDSADKNSGSGPAASTANTTVPAPDPTTTPDPTAAPDTAATPDATEAPETTVVEETTVPIELTASYEGVTETEIGIGVAVIDPQRIMDEYSLDIGIIPVADYYEALGAGLNKRGGINGRTARVVFRPFLPVGTAESEKACTELIQDEKVFMVIGAFRENNALCITEVNKRPYIGQVGSTPELLERSNGLFFSIEMAVGLSQSGAAKVLVDDGVLEGRKVALLWEGDTDKPAADAAKGVLEAAGVQIVSEVPVAGLAGDDVADGAAIDSAVARMQADGADLVYSVSPPLRLLESITRAGWGVDVALTTDSMNARLDARKDRDIDEGVLQRTIVVAPDAPNPQDTRGDAGLEQCISDYDAMFPDAPLNLADDKALTAALVHCRTFVAAVKILEATGADVTPETFRAAAEGMGTFELPGMLASLAPDKHDAGAGLRRYKWETDAGTWLPTGDPIAIG